MTNMPVTKNTKLSGYIWESTLENVEYEFLKSYIYAVYCGSIDEDDMDITRCLAHSSLNHRPQPVSALDSGMKKFPIIADSVLEGTAAWKGGFYEVTISKESHRDGVRVFTAYVLGLSDNANQPRSLFEFLKRRSMACSYYNRKTLTVRGKDFPDSNLIVKQTPIAGRNIEDIFISENKQQAIQLFVQSIKQYAEVRKPMRYILSGKPGTGKTEMIRAIIKECTGLATYFIVEGTTPIRSVFELAANFSPSVICMDDFDLLSGDRATGHCSQYLDDLLGLLDGFRSSPIFVLATTNEKSWIDRASSRPGRFDNIIDMEMLDGALYGKLIEQRLAENNLIESFTQEVLEELVRIKASGAFVVNLLKNIGMKKKLLKTTIDHETIIDAITELNKGFYKRPENGDNSLGFTANSN